MVLVKLLPGQPCYGAQLLSPQAFGEQLALVAL